jgi:hypothetical protein
MLTAIYWCLARATIVWTDTPCKTQRLHLLPQLHCKTSRAGSCRVSPKGLAFDNASFLWVTATDGNLYRYARADLVEGGVVRPVTTIAGFGETRGVLMSFNPKPRP